MKKTLLLLLLVMVPLLAPAQPELTKVRVTPQWTPQCQFAGLYMAYELGFYRDAGLDVEIIHPSIAVSSVALLRSGKTDIITSMLVEALIHKDAGVDLVQVLQTSAHNSLMILSRTPISSLKDLSGKKVAKWSVGFSEIAMAVATVVGANIDWISILSNIPFYIAGAVDATLCMSYNEFFQLKMAGVPITPEQILRFKDIGYDIPEDGLYVMDSYYQKNQELIKKFTEATKKGWEWIRESEEHRLQTLDCVMAMVKELNLPTNRVSQQYMLEEVLRTQEEEDGRAPYFLDKGRFEQAVDLLLTNGFIINPVAYGVFVK